MTDTVPGPPTRALVIANPASGSHSPELISQIEHLCAAHMPDVAVHYTTERGNATVAVANAVRGEGTEPAPNLVVAVGGDGTVREVVQGLAGVEGAAAQTALAIVPGGTGNSGYRMLWGDRPWSESLKSILTDAGGTARARRLDLALLEETGNLVFLGSCSGVIAQALITARTTPGHGRARYAKAFADTAAAFTPYPGRVTVDGEVIQEGPTVLANVGGGRFRGGQYLLLPRSELDDGLLDVCVIGGDIVPTDVPGLTLTADYLDMQGVAYGRGRTITLERLDGEPVVLEHDGEFQHLTHSAVTLSVRRHALSAWTATDL